jgi:hypothetical protein
MLYRLDEQDRSATKMKVDFGQGLLITFRSPGGLKLATK